MQAITVAAFAINLKANGQLIGNISLVAINVDQAELGYWLGEPFWNQGYGSEAATALGEIERRASCRERSWGTGRCRWAAERS